MGAIKVDFAEAAPATGRYHSRRTGLYKHDLYPLRYHPPNYRQQHYLSAQHLGR